LSINHIDNSDNTFKFPGLKWGLCLKVTDSFAVLLLTCSTSRKNRLYWNTFSLISTPDRNINRATHRQQNPSWQYPAEPKKRWQPVQSCCTNSNSDSQRNRLKPTEHLAVPPPNDRRLLPDIEGKVARAPDIPDTPGIRNLRAGELCLQSIYGPSLDDDAALWSISVRHLSILANLRVTYLGRAPKS